MSDVLILEKHKELFKDDEAVRKFAKILQTAANGKQIVVFDENLLGAMISSEEAKDRLYQRIAARLVRDPGSIEVLKERLESEDLVPPPDTASTQPARKGSKRTSQKSSK